MRRRKSTRYSFAAAMGSVSSSGNSTRLGTIRPMAYTSGAHPSLSPVARLTRTALPAVMSLPVSSA